MSERISCSKKSAEDSAPKKRCLSPELLGESPLPNKLARLDEKVSDEIPLNANGNKNGDVNKVPNKKDNDGNDEIGLDGQKLPGEEISAAVTFSNQTGADESTPLDAPVTSDGRKVDNHGSAGAGDCRPSTSLDQSDSAAIAAAEALASLTRAAAEDEATQMPCSSKTIGHNERMGQKVKRGYREFSKERLKSERGIHTQAVAADSSTSLRGVDRADVDDLPDVDEEDDSILGSSSTPSSSYPSDNDDDDDGECAIVSVKMAPEIRQSVALLAQVQMKLDALEKKGARLHQRLEMKMSHQRRPHLDQRSSITQAIPGFWVTALLNHPHLSAHIDETDEDALSYMTNLEIESIKNNKLSYRIGFHFRRNPYFQNNILVKELHLGMGGSPVSFSNPILWHRGQNLAAHSEPRRSGRGGVYQTFFNWFSDHSSPGRDDIAQILKDDLFRNPLRYYLTPLWEPRENGSTGGPKAADNSNGDDCVVISDSDEEEPAKPGQALGRGEEEEDEEEQHQGRDADDSDQEAREDDSSYGEKDEEADVKEVDEALDHKVTDQDEKDDIEVDEEEDDG
ncbi:testis specific protein Y-linked isoform X2 [Esox lucius]|uniref:Testis specific protein Y-linked n=1 Tax=Esox lucius TaxID=8010 RepID=A0A3P8Z1H0_ESOLU|nr:testis specific protein Y-linked isoform X2 [Esox lucius]